MWSRHFCAALPTPQAFRRRLGKAGRNWAKPMRLAGKFFRERRGAAASFFLLWSNNERRAIKPYAHCPPTVAPAWEVGVAPVRGSRGDAMGEAAAGGWTRGAMRSALRRSATQGWRLSLERPSGLARERRRAARARRGGTADLGTRPRYRARAAAAAEFSCRRTDPALPFAVQRGKCALHIAQRQQRPATVVEHRRFRARAAVRSARPPGSGQGADQRRPPL